MANAEVRTVRRGRFRDAWKWAVARVGERGRRATAHSCFHRSCLQPDCLRLAIHIALLLASCESLAMRSARPALASARVRARRSLTMLDLLAKHQKQGPERRLIA
jgi:hypothetical protein